MEIKQKFIILFFFFYGCTSNPFWEDPPTKKVNISGVVVAEGRISSAPLYIWIEDLDVSDYADTTGSFSIDIPSLEGENGNFSGSVRVFYYIHNYIAQHSDLYITDGRLTSAQTDFDDDGSLLDTIRLKKLVSLELGIEPSWNRSAGDSITFRMELGINDRPVTIFSHVNQISGQQGYEPSGVLFSLIEDKDVTYFDDNKIDFLQRYDFEPWSSITWTYNIAPDDLVPFVIDDYISIDEQSVAPGYYRVLPFLFIQQNEVPDKLVQSIGIFEVSNISTDFLNMPLDMLEKTISIE